jgi:hypothetical protein
VETGEQRRIASHSAQAESRRSQTQLAHAVAKAAWDTSKLPGWLDEKFYIAKIQPSLKALKLTAVVSAMHPSNHDPRPSAELMPLTHK